ncbi:hypothetical protein SAMN05421664_2966 [Chryseobacterium soldanellicola]|uniref:Uncharacterized protein n=1 Tax=Chryseobacterium soldanellicola TaxID=311333 RepID=A0A1H1FAH3_9FLAO|nr:hypothetical protein [Chryseobacterium soldanellicola]SDQ98093.1 hypothetical protein SAMN05421664_2966 [Chryseobacterium soldanellicola]
MKNISKALFCFLMIVSCEEHHKNTLNFSASIQENDELKENPLLMKPITTSIQPKDSTMSTLYGNDIAFDYAQHHSDSHYPENAILNEVTWKQKPDEVWFGGNIPKEIYSIERISFINSQSVYERYEGKQLRLISGYNAKDDRRKMVILDQRMAVSP